MVSLLERRQAEMRARNAKVKQEPPTPSIIAQPEEPAVPDQSPILDDLFKDGRIYQTPKVLAIALGWSPKTIIRDLRHDPDVSIRATYGPSGRPRNFLRVPRVSVERLLAKRLSNRQLKIAAPPLRPLRVVPLRDRDAVVSKKS